MKKSQKRKRSARNDAALEALIEEITVDASGDEEQLWAFRQAFQDNVALPTEGLVVGQPVSVLAIDYDGNSRRGLTARVRGADGYEHVIAASDLVMPGDTIADRYLAAYQKWMGLPTNKPVTSPRPLPGTRGLVDLIVLSVKEKAARAG